MASALPPRPPNQRAHSEPEFADPYAELAPRAPQQAMSANGQPQLDSPFTTSVSKVIMPRIPSSSSRASSTASIGSSKRSSRLRIGPNPFEAANSTDAIEEGNEEEEVGPLLPQPCCSVVDTIHLIFVAADANRCPHNLSIHVALQLCSSPRWYLAAGWQGFLQ